VKAVIVGISACMLCLNACAEQAFAEDRPASTVPASPPCGAGTSPGFELLVRSDFTDLGPLGTCTQNQSFWTAQGATLSLGDNLLTQQSSAAIDGLVAPDYRYYGNGDLIGYAFGPFVQGNDTYQLQPTSSQVPNGYTVTAGGFAEIAFNDPWTRSVQGIDDFRIRGGQVSSNTGTTSDSFVGEWIPSYVLGTPWNIGVPNHPAGSPLWYTAIPELMVQYDRLESGPNKFLLFGSRIEALRIGPQLAIQLSLAENKIPTILPGWVRDFLVNSTVLVSNHVSWDVYTGKEYSWTSASLAYTFPKFQHLGITLSYGYGNSEASGNRTNQVKLGFAVKF
jgi:hypothetical protein